MSCPRKVLGKGKEGTVYCVETNGRALAVKVFDKGSEAQRVRAIKRHREFLRRYAKSNLVPRLYGEGEDWLAMEVIPDSYVATKATAEVQRLAAEMTGQDRWSDIEKTGNFLLSTERNPARPVVFLEGGTCNHPWQV
jgi:hypothetical protein